MVSPVWGLRPRRALRSAFTSLPMPGIVNSPFFLVSFTAVSASSSRKPAVCLLVSSSFSARWRTSAVFVIPFAMCVAPSAFKNIFFLGPVHRSCINLEEKPHPFFNAKSSMFMRVRRTVPQFTFILSRRFVNHKSLVSTGFLRFFQVLFVFGHISRQKTQQNKEILFFHRLRLRPILPQQQA